MHIELIDTLRCPNDHEDTWLVGAFDRVVEREIIEGRLGCPVCGASYPISGGIVMFDDAAAQEYEDPRCATGPESASVGDEDALRLAAMLDLSSPGGLVVLEGAWAAAAGMLANFIDARFLVMNAPRDATEGRAQSGLTSFHTVPVAARSCRGIALHTSRHAALLARAAPNALRPGGRLVAPAATVLPPETLELARDERWWVAERSIPPPSLVPLSKR